MHPFIVEIPKGLLHRLSKPFPEPLWVESKEFFIESANGGSFIHGKLLERAVQSQFGTPTKQGHWSITQDPHVHAMLTKKERPNKRKKRFATLLFPARTFRRFRSEAIPMSTISMEENHKSPNNGKGKSSLPEARKLCLFTNSMIRNGRMVRKLISADTLRFVNTFCILPPSAMSNKRSLKIPTAVSTNGQSTKLNK
jgi:hypothetical protein